MSDTEEKRLEEVEVSFEFEDPDEERDAELISNIRANSEGGSDRSALMKENEDGGSQNLFALIQEMTIPEKLRMALLGNKVARSILIREPNRQIQRFVLENARIQEGEIVEFAKDTNLDQGVFRKIAKNGNWMKSYAIKLALVGNPKVPQDIALRYVKFLQDRHLRQLGKSKNIPQLIATQCRKTLERRGRR